MRRGSNRIAALGINLLPVACAMASLLHGPAVSVARDISFNRDVLPILAANCLSCHGFDAHGRQAGLRLDTAAGAVARLDSGHAAVVPGDAAASELVRRIDSADRDELMPPPESGRTLSAADRATLRDWIAAGGTYEKHWAFIPPGPQTPPDVAGPDHPIDRFVAARLTGTGLTPSPPAPPESLLRRLHLDLTGLPPTTTEIDGFLTATASDPEAAYAAAVDRLLESPHYGERLARWWLDMARYADSNGYSIDAPREIWRYRDWVIDAFNRDLPFDRFTIEQLAGDLLPEATEEQKIATGFHRNTQINEEGGIDKEQFRIESVFDRVATTGVVWLGLSIGCAQCHDHKFDPVSQRDYYRLFAFLNNQAEPKLKVTAKGFDPVALKQDRDAALAAAHAYVESRLVELAAWESTLTDELKKPFGKPTLAALEKPAAERSPEDRRLLYAAGPGTGDQEFRSLNERYLELDGKVTNGPTTLVLQELPTPRTTTILVQGDFTRPGDAVQPGTPDVLPPLEPCPTAPNRLDLARWLVSPANPLTPRVLVNRVWQRCFGRGLVETDNDFGLMGSAPSHPELLDWLAAELVRREWSLKALHRLIVTSRTYRQSSIETPVQAAADPHNLLLARQRRLRLDAEIVRDVALVASGRLAPAIGGPPVFPPIPDGATAVGQVKRAWKTSTGDDRHRRGLYTFVYRASPPPALSVFDAPDGYSACTRRNRSNTPLQALTLLNDQAFVELADALAEVIGAEGLDTAFRRCTGRRPDAAELATLSRLTPREQARVLLNLDETVTRE
jgi:cytochrome c553